MPEYAPRDERGYRVPCAGTLSRRIYELVIAGATAKVIASKVERDPKMVSVIIHKIKNPAKANLWGKAYARRQQAAVREKKAADKSARWTVTGFRRQTMLDYIIRHPEGVTVWQIMTAVYGDDLDGGPERSNIVNVMAVAINKQIEWRGFKIKGSGGPGSLYKLVTL